MMKSGPPPAEGIARASRWSRWARGIVYSAVVCVAALLAVSWIVETLERHGWIDLSTPDSSIVYLDTPPYVRRDDRFETSPTLRPTMIFSTFRAVKGDAWRMFVLGESFAMGTPYVHQDQETPHEGGIASWLAADLRAIAPDRPIEIINAAAASQNSNRVRALTEAVVQLDPDAILIAACNNEGVLPPARIDAILHKTGGYRLIAKLLAPSIAREDRSYFTPQDPDVNAIRDNFRTNIHGMVNAARARRVPVFLCTMPVNLRYAGGGAGITLRKADRTLPEPESSACTRTAKQQLDAGEPAAAVTTLRGCDPDLEGIRTLGLALFSLGRHAEAHAALEAYTELVPRNRCRPSLNAIIRAEAQSNPDVHLVDLEAAAEALSPGGVPGEELFVDYCHMNWAGYAAMADTIRQAIYDADLGPRPSAGLDRLPPRAAQAAEWGLPDLAPAALTVLYK